MEGRLINGRRIAEGVGAEKENVVEGGMVRAVVVLEMGGCERRLRMGAMGRLALAPKRTGWAAAK